MVDRDKLVRILVGRPSGNYPTVGELLQVLGYETIYEALEAMVKEKGLWKDEWTVDDRRVEEKRE